MAEKQNPKERLKEITDSIEVGIKELFESDKYKSYLQTMSRFHKYSLNNTMLISMQKPDATLVAGFNKWRDGFSRYVKKGEKGIKIIAPTPYKIKEEREKLDPQTKSPLLDASGKVQTEEVEIQIPMFRVVSVFDVSQTEGEPLPTLASNLTGNVEQFEMFMEAVKRTAPVPIEIKPMAEDTDGYYHIEDKRIAIREGMSEVQTISAAIHEVAHSLLHNREMEKELQSQQSESKKPMKPKDRNTEEVEAESISFAVCSYYGIQTAENSLGYIATWSKGKELAELRASLETINKTSSELISGIDTHFAEIIKERGIDKDELTEQAKAVSQEIISSAQSEHLITKYTAEVEIAGHSMVELYTMQRYLQYDTLREKGLLHFDAWASTFGETVTQNELAPEGKGYRPRTRFSKFFNLPELMSMFKEVADIKTADELNLPTPEVVYETVVAKPTEIQQELVQELSERAARIHNDRIDPSIDNMLKVTSDGRKLGLDQRVINPLLPDDEGSKVNTCVNNILRIWEDGKDDKLTQLLFCDLSTPKGRPQADKVAKAGGSAINGVELHALEDALPDDITAVQAQFSIYEDIREKLIAKGVPATEVAFIHEANTDTRKKELFAKVRSGDVRVLLGSTAKCGAGMNVQDRLVALHDLDCPWRPGDLTQRSGRIIRQGNNNEQVKIFRYVTEDTFDAYLWQTVENKQKFISQIMTSKSPVRSCEDIDEAALSYAEIKALCAGNPLIKEKMDLDIEVAKLKLLKANHQSTKYRLEDNLLKHFPESIERHKGYIKGFEQDIVTLTEHTPKVPQGELLKDDFKITIKGDTLTDKDNAGAAILEACKEVKNSDPVEIGSYKGFTMYLSYAAFGNEHTLTLKGAMSHTAKLGLDARGNLTRIDNALNNMPQRLQSVQKELENLYNQQAAAKVEVQKPFTQEQELKEKTARLAVLDKELNMSAMRSAPSRDTAMVSKQARPSILDSLKQQPPKSAMPPKKSKSEREER